jgi:hypothetical protein
MVGMAMLASAAVLFALAVLFWARFLPIDEDGRPIVAGVVLVAALADFVIGFRFLGSSDF